MENEYLSQDTDEWVEIESSFSTGKAECHSIENSRIIRENYFSDTAVFPPDNHENLAISTSEQEHLHAKEPRRLPSASADAGAEETKGEGGVKWWKMGLEFLRSKIGNVCRKLKMSKDRLWVSASAPTGVGIVVMLMLVYVRLKGWRRQVQLLNEHHLMLLIKEKDQKINQLSIQIDRLNDMLLASRRVPVLRAHSVVSSSSFLCK